MPPDRYVGFDIDESTLEVARARYPSHRFTSQLPEGEAFDTVVSMAVIEHVEDPVEYLLGLRAFVRDGGCVILTTPHPSSKAIYGLGARLGIFSKLASEEHHPLLGEAEIARSAQAAELQVVRFGTFMAGANQLAVLSPASPSGS